MILDRRSGNLYILLIDSDRWRDRQEMVREGFDVQQRLLAEKPTCSMEKVNILISLCFMEKTW